METGGTVGDWRWEQEAMPAGVEERRRERRGKETGVFWLDGEEGKEGSDVGRGEGEGEGRAGAPSACARFLLLLLLGRATEARQAGRS